MNAQQLYLITDEQLKSYAQTIAQKTAESILDKLPEMMQQMKPEYVWGLQGIQDLFNVSHAQAQEYKNTFLQPAVSQRGRKIRVNVAMAEALYDEYKGK